MSSSTTLPSQFLPAHNPDARIIGTFKYYFRQVQVHHQLPAPILENVVTKVRETPQWLREIPVTICAVALEAPHMSYGLAFGGSLVFFQGHIYVAAVHQAIQLGYISPSDGYLTVIIYQKGIVLLNVAFNGI